MQQSNRNSWAKPIPNSLNFSQEQVTFFVGHSLRSLYADLLLADLPDKLKALAQELENKQTAASNTR